MSPARPILFLLLLALPVACAQFPELDAVVSEEAMEAPSPDLVENSVLLQPVEELVLDESTAEELQARAAALEARAKAASEPAISPQERQVLLERAARLRAEAARVAQEG